MNQVKEGARTLQEVVDWFRAEDDTLNETGDRIRNRLLLIERLLPAWLAFDAKHPVFGAVLELDALDFGTLLGRAIVLPMEEGKEFEDIETQWLFASAGLPLSSTKIGRPEAVGTMTQIVIYYQWLGGESTQKELAEEYQVSPATIARIIRRWKPKD